jgi:hypothetical protein
MCLLALCAWCASEPKVLWFDEQLGLAAARVPRLADIPAALALPVDINPPLHHMLMHLSIGLLGYSAMTARLPSLLAMMGFLLCLFVFVSRRLRPSYGILAVLLVLCVPVIQYAWEARPYTLLLCLTGTALVSYQARIDGRGIVPLTALLVSCAGLILTHYYGLPIVGAFAAGETVRTLRRKQFDWPLAGGLLVAPGATILLLSGLIRSQLAVIRQYPAHAQLYTLMDGYGLYTMETPVFCVGLAGLALLPWLGRSAEERPRQGEGAGFSAPEIAVAAFLLALPLLGFAVAGITRVYVPRYFVAAAAGYAILVCHLAAFVQRRYSGVTLVLTLTAAAGLSWYLLSAVKHRNDPPRFAQVLAALELAHAPVLFEDAKDYLISREYDPAFAGRLYYAADPRLAFQMTGAGFDDRFMLAMAKLQPVQAMPLDDIARKSDVWILVPASYGWLRKCLGRMGSSVQSSTPISAVDPHPITIRLPHPDTMATSWCEAPPAR